MRKIPPCEGCKFQDLKIAIIDKSYSVYCPKCKIFGPSSTNEKTAIDLWGKKNLTLTGFVNYQNNLPNITDNNSIEPPQVIHDKKAHWIYRVISQVKLIFPLEVKELKAIFWLIIILGLVVVPACLMFFNPKDFTYISQILFDILLFVASTLFAFSISNKEAKKVATGKWLPAAEISCNQLLTIANASKRIRKKQSQFHQSIEPLITGIPNEKTQLIKKIIEFHCNDISESLIILENQIDDCSTNWNVFITSNCDKGECHVIENRLKERQFILNFEIDSDFPSKES